MRIPLILCTLFSLSISLNAMEKPYHHVYKDGKLYAFKNHNTRKRMQNYYLRHSRTRKRNEAIQNEKKKSNYYYNAKILSHIYLW